MNIIQLINNVHKEGILSFIKRLVPASKYQLKVKLFHANGEINEAMVYPSGLEKNFQDTSYKINIRRKLKQINDSASPADPFFIANISHEIRTPMNAIMGFSNMLNEPDLNTDERKVMVNMINDNCFRLLNTVDLLADYSLIKHNKITPAERDFEVAAMIADICQTYKFKAEKKQLKFKTKISHEYKDTNIKTDYDLLKKIVSYAVDNAIKFTEKGHVEVACKREKTSLQFWVTDTGIGIPKDKISLIFKEFRQVEESLTRTYQGVGLGLTLAASFVTLLNGDIELRSTMNKGTVFHFQIPLSQSLT